MREAIADFEVQEPWGPTGRRYLCRPPGRLGREGPVMVTEVSVDADGWQQLCDHLLRLASAPGDGLLETIEVGPDLATGQVFLATEAAERALAEDDTLDTAARLQAVEAAARAVHTLHEAGLAHGWIHPGTVLLTGRGPVVDLPRLDAPAGEVLRVSGWTELATIDPELLSGESPSRRSDIWALGATLHGVLSGRPLFPGIESDEPVTAVQRVMFTRPVPDPGLAEPIRQLIDECLAADPADRPPTALSLAERLSQIRAAG